MARWQAPERSGDQYYSAGIHKTEVIILSTATTTLIVKLFQLSDFADIKLHSLSLIVYTVTIKPVIILEIYVTLWKYKFLLIAKGTRKNRAETAQRDLSFEGDAILCLHRQARDVLCKPKPVCLFFLQPDDVWGPSSDVWLFWGGWDLPGASHQHKATQCGSLDTARWRELCNLLLVQNENYCWHLGSTQGALKDRKWSLCIRANALHAKALLKL